MSCSRSSLSPRGIIDKLLKKHYPSRALAFQAVLYCEDILSTEASNILVRELRQKFIVTYTLDEFTSQTAFSWDTGATQTTPSKQTIFHSH